MSNYYGKNSDENLDKQAKCNNSANPEAAIWNRSEEDMIPQPLSEMEDILQNQNLSLGYREELQGRLVKIIDNLKSNEVRKSDGKTGEIEKTPNTVVEILRYNNRRLVSQNEELEQIVKLLESAI